MLHKIKFPCYLLWYLIITDQIKFIEHFYTFGIFDAWMFSVHSITFCSEVLYRHVYFIDPDIFCYLKLLFLTFLCNTTSVLDNL